MSRKPKGPGRPKGAKNIETAAEVAPSRCPHCGSSRRSKYRNPYYRDYSGQGLPFIGIHYRACTCLDCGQARRDQEKVYEPEKIQPENKTFALISSPDVLEESSETAIT